MHWNYTITIILSSSIAIAGILGILKFAQIQNAYRPFIYLVWVGCFAEVMSIYFSYRYHNNLAIQTVYTLLESLLLLWFFHRLGVFKKKKKFINLLGAVFVVSWAIDNFWSGAFGQRYSFYFDIIYAPFIVLLSIRAINDLIFTERELFKNPTFLICLGLIIFFTCQIIQKMFGIYGLKDSIEFRTSVQRVLTVITCLTNLVFAAAVLWMRKRHAFTFRFE